MDDARGSLEELNLIDDFLFNELLLQNTEYAEELVRATLEPILGKKIGKIEVNAQRIIQGLDTQRRGIRMDAYVTSYEDETGQDVADVRLSESPIIYDIEPNKIKDDDAKRARLYHSIIDSNFIKSGTPYSDIPDTYVIFILSYDPFGLDSMVYTAKTQIEEYPELNYDDGAVTLFLNAKGHKNVPSQELKNMLEFYLNSTEENARKAGATNLYKIIDKVKHNEKVQVKYMWTWEKEQLLKKVAKDEGKAEGKTEGRISMLIDLYRDKVIDLDTAVANSGLSAQEFQKLLN